MHQKGINKVWFTSDLHLGHTKILGFHERGYKDIEEQDKAIIKYWNETVQKNDTIYILGDLSLYNTDKTRAILQKLNGNKILISGNHDSSSIRNSTYFSFVKSIYLANFKKSIYPFLENDLSIVLCHYPMLSWEKRDKGAAMLHGHCHGKIDNTNKNSKELRIDVGWDGLFAHHKFVDLETVYKHLIEIAKTPDFKEYILNNIFFDVCK